MVILFLFLSTGLPGEENGEKPGIRIKLDKRCGRIIEHDS